MSTTTNQSSAASEIWHQIERNNASLAQVSASQKTGQSAIAAGNRSLHFHQFEKDVILPFEVQDEALLSSLTKSGLAGKPHLSNPSSGSALFDGADPDQMGLIAIIGAVLALQAKSNSQFWSTLWKQASQSMEMQVKFAPIVGDAIRSQYKAQSDATQSQSDQSNAEGWINISMFVGSMIMGVYMEEKNPTDKTTATDKSAEFDEDKDTTKTDSTKTGDNALTTDEQEMDNVADEVLNDEQKASAPRANKYLEWFTANMKLGNQRFTAYFGRGMQIAQGFSMLAQAATGFNASKYQNQQAIAQGLEGQAAATSQEGQIYSQFYSQDFSRNEDLRQGSSQNIDYAMNILQQAANSITQTVTSMFRG